MSEMAAKWGRVWRYEGPRGVVWRIRYRDASGRRILETLGKEPAWNRKRAETELRRRLVDVERDGYQAPDKTTFAAFAERWQSEYLPGRGLKQTTLESYQQTLGRHLLPAFGTYQLKTLEQQPDLIDRYIAAKTRAGLSPKTLTNHLLLLQVMLKRAVRWRLISRNPVHEIDRPRLHQPDLQILTPTQIARLATAYTEPRTKHANRTRLGGDSRTRSRSPPSAPPSGAASCSRCAGATSTCSKEPSKSVKRSSAAASRPPSRTPHDA